jgi:hypothetical protein
MIDKYKWQRKFWLFLNQDSKAAIVLIWLLLLCSILLFSILPVDAHEVHLSDVQNKFCPMVRGPNWHSGIGSVIATQCEGQPIHWYLLDKKTTTTHSGVHVKQLTLQEMEDILEYN